MKKNETALSAALTALLDEKLPDAERQSLTEEGYILKKPTRKAALAVAIYKKAVSGDLSAIKELRSILGENTETKTRAQAVVIIDDTED